MGADHFNARQVNDQMKAITRRLAWIFGGVLGMASVTLAAPSDSLGATKAGEMPSNPALRDELLAMTVDDQAARTKIVDQLTEGDRQHMMEVDKKHEERMKAIIGQFGWPGRRLVGDQAATDAWLIVQHCQVEFEEKCLPLLKEAVDAGDMSGKWYAYLLDRVRMYRGQPQVYGTQFMNDKLVPIEDPERVDQRRKAVGLGPLSEYVALVCKMNGWPNPSKDPKP